MDNEIPPSVKIDQPEVYIDCPDEEMKDMESHSLLASTNIKLEPACEEADSIQCSTREIISEVQAFDKKDSKIPACVKIEQPAVNVDYPSEDMKIHACSQSCPSLQEQSQMEKKTYTGEKFYKYDVCDASFALRSHLNDHMRTHTGEKSYKCDVCTASLASSSQLKCHMRTHTGEKPYKCDVCAISFAFRSHLKRHMRTHTGEKPYMCDICAISFAHSHHLNEHMRAHTGEKPYKCYVCTASFTWLCNMKKHVRTHTGFHLRNVKFMLHLLLTLTTRSLT